MGTPLPIVARACLTMHAEWATLCSRHCDQRGRLRNLMGTFSLDADNDDDDATSWPEMSPPLDMNDFHRSQKVHADRRKRRSPGDR